jgi:hypothetical protein
MRSLLVMGIPYQHAPEVSIVRTDTCSLAPGEGRVEGERAKSKCRSQRKRVCGSLISARASSINQGNIGKFCFTRNQVAPINRNLPAD